MITYRNKWALILNWAHIHAYGFLVISDIEVKGKHFFLKWKYFFTTSTKISRILKTDDNCLTDF